MKLSQQQIITAIRIVQASPHWKPGSVERHLSKRILRGHLPIGATVSDYARVIQAVLTTDDAQIYLYWYNESAYITVTAIINTQYWLVMFSLDGAMESAYVVENPERYLNKKEFERIGLLSEILT
ncbi:MAG: hypothetical protein U0350_34460 [Caldilineaceae bacterium]